MERNRMRNPFKILIIGAGPEITYLVVGPGITIRSTLSSAGAARLLETEAMDLILGPPHILAGVADREFPVDQAA